MLVDKLRMPVPPQQNAEIVELGHHALQLNTVHQKYGEGYFAFSNVIEKSVLQILRTLGCHGRFSIFCSRLTRETFRCPSPSACDLKRMRHSAPRVAVRGPGDTIRWQAVFLRKHKFMRALVTL